MNELLTAVKAIWKEIRLIVEKVWNDLLVWFNENFDNKYFEIAMRTKSKRIRKKNMKRAFKIC